MPAAASVESPAAASCARHRSRSAALRAPWTAHGGTLETASRRTARPSAPSTSAEGRPPCSVVGGAAGATEASGRAEIAGGVDALIPRCSRSGSRLCRSCTGSGAGRFGDSGCVCSAGRLGGFLATRFTGSAFGAETRGRDGDTERGLEERRSVLVRGRLATVEGRAAGLGEVFTGAELRSGGRGAGSGFGSGSSAEGGGSGGGAVVAGGGCVCSASAPAAATPSSAAAARKARRRRERTSPMDRPPSIRGRAGTASLSPASRRATDRRRECGWSKVQASRDGRPPRRP